MINFRYHVISIIAVFLALGIGVIMGTAVIDRAVVDRLERQQSGLQRDVDEVQSENNRLRSELRQERAAAARLAEEGGQRLLNGALAGVPVLVVATREADIAGVDELIGLLQRASADYRGMLWLTDRFRLDGGNEVRDLAAALSFRPDATAGTLRSAAVTRLARRLRSVIGESDAPPAGIVGALREAGFLDYEPPDDAEDDVFPTLDPTTRFVLLSAPDAEDANRQLMLPLVRGLASVHAELAPVPLLVASSRPVTDSDDSFISAVRSHDELVERVSTIDDVDAFAGRLAAVLALADLGAGRVGHYGVGAGAQRLLPAPVE